jgi:hypothetical protein
MDELLQTAIVRRTAVVLVVAPQFRVEHLLLGFRPAPPRTAEIPALDTTDSPLADDRLAQ